MKDKVLKSILDNISYPVALEDVEGNVLYKNEAFHFVEPECVLKKTIETDGEKYFLLYSEENCSRLQQDFLSTLSHELRTPLTSIRGFADTMLMSADKLSKDQTNKFLKIIRNQADRLTRLLENLLEVSSFANNNKLVFKEINFEKFIYPIVLIFEKKYPDRIYKTNISSKLPPVWADADCLEQIMSNLIDNASKYSSSGSTITIEAKFFDNSIDIKVIDQAVLIPSAFLDKIFNKFSRIDNPLTRKVEGSGLGLFITKTLTEKMNGKVYAQNYENGNIFTLSLPVSNIETQLSSKIKGEQ